jgi:hypothetical protein
MLAEACLVVDNCLHFPIERGRLGPKKAGQGDEFPGV